MKNSKNKKKQENSAAKKIAEQKRKKKKQLKIIIGSVVAVLALLIWFGLQPLTAGMPYGICRTFIETKVKYPDTIKINQYDEFGPSVRLFYTHRDAYGSQRSEMIECIFSQMEGSYVIDKININRKPVSDKEVRFLNMSIPGIVAGNPDLIIPYPFGEGNLRELKND